ncbi:COP9 signalosome complex subunit 1-like isoform X2 [Varroa jacobsoni]|nr:COP9 signalosome complex subunit 1-like isoform X2 [Varroa destructor]XP_022650924.1 COP9 signalosome complex subunit 1-like isoform X2 [Varroa destructor]XP_022696726.1 COP9 signalosome complex subunit 1-like isoform X2 [Varroa jacobsoni]
MQVDGMQVGIDECCRAGEPAAEEPIVTVHRPTLELESYAANYTGLAKLNRLMFIADRCPTLRVEALRMALDHVMGTLNVAKYTEIHRKLTEALSRGPPSDVQMANAGPGGVPDVAESNEIPPLDNAWIDTRTKQTALKTEKLDTDLKNYKANSIKESIRRGTDDLGEHYLDCGDLNNALRCFGRARDYCTSGKHIVDYCLNVTRVSVYLQNWQHVECYVAKAENTPEVIEATSSTGQGPVAAGGNAASSARDCISPVVINKLRCCNGLANLATRKYKKAAHHFLQANAYNCDFPDIMAARDVAIYAGLCALASFDRAELARNIIQQQNFKQFLELDPQLRELIQHFYESRYGQCLALLDQIRDNLLLDIYLAPHVISLYAQIRNRAWIQYFSPYLTADMNMMAVAFNTTVQQVEEEMMQLVLDNQIQARIDSHNKVIYAKDVDPRASTFEKCLQIGDEFEKKTKALMLRAALIKNRVCVKCPPRGSGSGQVTNGDGERPS